jgi:hypothetical protein
MKVVAKVVVFSTMLVSIAQAASPKVAPKLYRVDGRPVPASCLETLSSPERGARQEPIDLRKCGDAKLKPKALDDGSVGYDEPEAGWQGGYFYYSYLGRSGGIDILSLQSSGGGTGRFTQLVGVTHDGHFIRWAKDYAGGDRCNGGVSDEKVSNGKLTFDQAITPYDLIRLTQPKEKLKAYKDLEASAASCIGVVHMMGDDKHWTGVTLTEKDWPDQKGWTENYRYQACFNKMYRETVSSGHVELDRRGVVAFADAFAKRCVHGR